MVARVGRKQRLWTAPGGPGKPRKRPTHHEGDDQAKVVRWAREHRGVWPELAWLHSSVNGANRVGVLGIQVAQGMVAGIPDLCLPSARGGYLGLYIEMKSLTGRAPVGDQRLCLDYLSRAGYRAVWCRGAEAGIAELAAYMQLAPTQVMGEAMRPKAWLVEDPGSSPHRPLWLCVRQGLTAMTDKIGEALQFRRWQDAQQVGGLLYSRDRHLEFRPVERELP